MENKENKRKRKNKALTPLKEENEDKAIEQQGNLILRSWMELGTKVKN